MPSSLSGPNPARLSAIDCIQPVLKISHPISKRSEDVRVAVSDTGAAAVSCLRRYVAKQPGQFPGRRFWCSG